MLNSQSGHATCLAAALKVPNMSGSTNLPCVTGPSSVLAFPSSTVLVHFLLGIDSYSPFRKRSNKPLCLPWLLPLRIFKSLPWV